MDLRNGENGYGVVTKSLHWLTVLAIATQFVIGYSVDADAADDRVAVFEDRGEQLAENQGETAEERFEAQVKRREDAADALDRSPGRSNSATSSLERRSATG